MSRIKYLVMDVDGTLTDGHIYMDENGEAFKSFNIKDGYAIHEILPKYNIEPVIITGRVSRIVDNRSKELGITHIYQAVKDKANKLQEIIESNNDLENCAYIGDDDNDLSAMRIIKKCNGVIGCPSDASKEVRSISDYICHAAGGKGAVREFIEWLVGKG